MLKFSTGFRNSVLGTNPAKTVMAGGQIMIYSGPVPATADAALDPSCVLLTTITNNGVGINFDAPTGGSLPKAAAETWSGTNAATGTASFFRHVAPGDDATASTTQPRLQGSVATAGGELNLSDVNLVQGAVQSLDFYTLAFPTL